MSISAINYTQASNSFIDVYMSKCSGSAVKVFLAISRKTIGWHKTSDRISYSQLAELTGITNNTLKKAIKELIAFGLITQSETKFGYSYDLNISENDTGVSEIDTAMSKIDTGVSKNDTTKETNLKETNLKDNIVLIVEYLNNKIGTNYKPTTDTTIKFITARFNDGYTVDQFKIVIDKKCKEWLGTDQEKYLRPFTLFGTKFESYLNQKITIDKTQEPATIKKCPACLRNLSGGRCVNQSCEKYEAIHEYKR